jgi:N-acetylglutamate synthase
MTDLLGVMESWSPPVTTIRDADGALTTIRLGDIVSGKPVPPRPSVRLRVSPEDAERRALESWPAVESVPLGDWVLRASGGFSSRANSVLAVGDPGLPVAEALDVAGAFYAARELPAWAQVVVGSQGHAALEDAGWVLARPGEADTVFELASVARAVRLARSLLPSEPRLVERGTAVTSAWLADDARARSYPNEARSVPERPAHVLFATVTGPDGAVVAKGRAGSGPDGDWVGITDVWVDPRARRQGLGVLVVHGLLEWAAELGAGTAYLQVRGDNPAGLALYERLGFLAHHAYRYLTPPH